MLLLESFGPSTTSFSTVYFQCLGSSTFILRTVHVLSFWVSNLILDYPLSAFLTVRFHLLGPFFLTKDRPLWTWSLRSRLQLSFQAHQVILRITFLIPYYVPSSLDLSNFNGRFPTSLSLFELSQNFPISFFSISCRTFEL